MQPIPNEIRNFHVIHSQVEYWPRRDRGFLTLNAIMDGQSDNRLCAMLLELQETIRGVALSLGVDLVDDPAHHNGLYLYPRPSIHCSLVDITSERKDSFAEVRDKSFDDHPLMTCACLEIRRFSVRPRWFYCGDHDKGQPPSTANSFSLGMFIESGTKIALERQCLELTGVKEEAKAYKTSSSDVWRAVTNIARFISDEAVEPQPIEHSTEFVSLFEDFESQMGNQDLGEFEIDTLFLVKSDPWLSNPSPILREFVLVK